MRIDNIRRVVTEVNTKYGAPMGRSNVIPQHYNILDTPIKCVIIGNGIVQRYYDKRVPMIDGVYDIGGAYWGIGSELRVRFSKDLQYIEFYRR